MKTTIIVLLAVALVFLGIKNFQLSEKVEAKNTQLEQYQDSVRLVLEKTFPSIEKDSARHQDQMNNRFAFTKAKLFQSVPYRHRGAMCFKMNYGMPFMGGVEISVNYGNKDSIYLVSKTTFGAYPRFDRQLKLDSLQWYTFKSKLEIADFWQLYELDHRFSCLDCDALTLEGIFDLRDKERVYHCVTRGGSPPTALRDACEYLMKCAGINKYFFCSLEGKWFNPMYFFYNRF